MKRVKEAILFALFAGMLVVSCSDDSGDQDPGPNPPPPPSGGNVTVTSIGAGDLFWGEEMTINGTGFSTVKEENIVKFTDVEPPTYAGGCDLKYSSVQGDIEIVSASATQLKIKVPLKQTGTGNPICGPRQANLEVTVGGKVATFQGLEFAPLLVIGSFAYHYGWLDVPTVTRIGDSVMLSGGLLATPANSSKYWDKLRLSINGTDTPIKYRSIGLEHGWSFFLPVEDYAELNCSEDPDGWGAREMEFKFYLEGTNRSVSKNLFVQYLPEQTASCDLCPSPITSQNEEWVIKGKNMYFTEVLFSPISPCTGASQGMAIVHKPWTDQIKFSVPTSLFAENCGYGVYLTNDCTSVYIGNVGI
jgi:hypothetical protein